ncbi:cell division site-positioning protein MapZ family protein [Enterococcus sp. LJL98]
MIKKCPHCEFEPIQDQLICPSCGSELNENISKQIKEDQTLTTPLEESEKESNDNINWSNYQEVSLGSVMEHFNDAIDEEAADSTNEFADNPILEAYIRRHRNGDQAADQDLVAAIEKQKEEKEESLAEPSVIVTKGEEDVEEKEAAPTFQEETKTEQALTEMKDAPLEETTTLEASATVTEAPVEEALSSLQGNLEAPLPTADDKQAEATKEEIKAKQPIPGVSIVEEEAQAKERSQTEMALERIRQFEEKEQQTLDPLPPLAGAEQEPTKETPKTNERQPKKQKNKKWLYLTAAGVLFAAGGGWLYVDAQQKAEAARQEQIQQEKDFSTLTQQIEGFYLDEAQQFVKPEKTIDELNKLIDQLPAFKQQEKYSEVQTLSQDLRKKMGLIDTINASFTKPIIVGDQLDKEVHIKSTEPISTELLTEKTLFAILANEALQLGKIELQQVQSAQEAVAEVTSFYQEGKLSADLSRKTFDGVKKQVSDLFEIADKETLLAELEPVEKALVAREKAEKEAKLAAEKKAAEEEAAKIAYEEQQQALANQGKRENAGQEILSANTPTNRNNQPIIASRQSDINDVNHAGWAWAPGVYDAFIKTVIDRGYVVADGFYLEPVRIENGEGYYHLYATSNQSKLLTGTPQSSLPFYLVTVNAKTGYFKGNGSN